MITQHLNQTQLAVRWTISPRTLERWRWLGQGPRFLKIGGRVIYRLEDIQAFEAEQSRAGPGFSEGMPSPIAGR
ncbi:MAG: helix-turn-helix domain-containing protein [Pseudomonadota bacterium]